MDLGRKIGLSAAEVNTINNIITKHMAMRQFCFSIIHLFIVLILDRSTQHKRGFFRKDVGDGLFFSTQLGKLLILFTNTTLNRFGFGMLTVRIAMFHYWLHFNYIC